MVFWRISNYLDLTGLGAELSAGRWHTSAEGKRVLYLTEHPAVALLESLANLRGDPRFFQHHFQLLKISSQSKTLPRQLSKKQFASINRDNLKTTQALGDAWLAAKSSALLRVPSFPSPESWNYLFNPLHPDASSLKLDWAKHIAYDKRLFHVTYA
jgi:RES domain-containing protein